MLLQFKLHWIAYSIIAFEHAKIPLLMTEEYRKDPKGQELWKNPKLQIKLLCLPDSVKQLLFGTSTDRVRPYVSLRRTIFDRCHPRIWGDTSQLITRRFFWPSLPKIQSPAPHNLTACDFSSVSSVKPCPSSHGRAAAAYRRNKYVLMLVDQATGWPKARLIADLTVTDSFAPTVFAVSDRFYVLLPK